MPILMEKYTYGDYAGNEYVQKEGKRFRGWVVATFFTIVVMAVIVGIAFGIRSLVFYSDHTDCNKFEKHSGIQTTYADYGFWSNECFALMPDGTKIPVDDIVVNKGN